MRTLLAASAATVLLAAPASAELVQVEINGIVEFNQISGGELGMANPGDDASISFLLDSNVFMDSPNFPTRGYEIIQDSFVFTAGAATLGLQNPFPGGMTPYFVLRDNDPAVDGFFLGTNVDVPFGGVPLSQEGIIEQFASNFAVSYSGDTLNSLDILDAVGTYDFTGLKSFNYTVLDGPFDAMGLVFEDLTITVIPAPAALALLAPLGLVSRRRRH